jgi:AraC-like DNA-binding protein/ligand-binding sensor protein
MKDNKTRSGNLPQYNDGLLEKSMKMMAAYGQSTGSSVCIYDHSFMQIPVEYENEDAGAAVPLTEITICANCASCGQCGAIHTNAIMEANGKGGLHIYRCDLGLIFWTSPIYTEGSFSSALRGSGFVDRSFNADEKNSFCKEGLNREEFKNLLLATPQADEEKIQSLAEMMLMCAEALSSGSEDYHEILRRRAGQQEIIARHIEELKIRHPEGKPGYPLEKERQLITALRKGDSAEAKNVLNELLALLVFSNPGRFKYIQLRATELAVVLSRIEVSPGKNATHAMETSSRSLKNVQEAKTFEELTDVLHGIADRISGQISSFCGIPHAAAMQKVENYIHENYTRKISLKEVADVAGLSAPYFSAIFKEEMGENLSKYLNRLRVERASRLLLETNMSLSEIAGDCCFEDQSWFSKNFKAYTGISPGKYRNNGGMVRDISENNMSQDFKKILK